MKETWVKIPGFPKYKVNRLGQVLGIYGKILRPNYDHRYFFYKLYLDGAHTKMKQVKKIRALAKIGKLSQSEIGKRFGVCSNLIHKIHRNKSYILPDEPTFSVNLNNRLYPFSDRHEAHAFAAFWDVIKL